MARYRSHAPAKKSRARPNSRKKVTKSRVKRYWSFGGKKMHVEPKSMHLVEDILLNDQLLQEKHEHDHKMHFQVNLKHELI
jgi:hypothetical protein